MKVYERFAQTLQALRNCEKPGALSYAAAPMHRRALVELSAAHMPAGSGFDNGTTFDIEKSTPNRLLFSTSFHHMNDVGFYCGWSDHSVIVIPDLSMRFNLRITGRDICDIKGYIHSAFEFALNGDIES